MSGLVQINLPAVDGILRQLWNDPTTFLGGIAKRLLQVESDAGDAKRQAAVNAAAITKLQSSIAALQQPAASTQTKVFIPNGALQARPGAGLYSTSAHLRPKPAAPWNPDIPMRVEQYLLNLDAYRDVDTLPDSFLQAVDDRLAATEQSPVRDIIRPRYVTDASELCAPKARVLGHMDQLAPILNAHPAALLAVEFGWAGGAWDEEHIADNAPCHNITGSDSGGWILGQLARHWLSLTPDWLPILHRRFQFIDQGDQANPKSLGMFASPLKPGQAFDGSDQSRVGGYNDCLGGDGSAWEGGGFNLSGARLDSVLKAVTSRVFTCGETCSSGGITPDRTPSGFAAYVKRLHLDALHASYWTAVYDGMTSDQLRVLQGTIGARLALNSVALPTEIVAGQPIKVDVQMQNDGSGKVTVPYGMELQFIASNGGVRSVPLLADARTSLPLAGETRSLSLTATAPANLGAGSYGVALAMPDPHSNTPERAMPFANDEWNATAARVDLGMSVTV